ncbi:helix-turn-helix domain-containing protein [Agromyces allii]|uniref:HTH arsR-type domain-containing protein n=1 Tax=Agromyces allii TaxID=393607 RepID=A0ABP5BYT2_9MICO|nr:helix-turn-helix domain-containing protein [Agromyces allii]
MNQSGARIADMAATTALITDPTRARLLTLLLTNPDGRSTVTVLARELGLRQPTVTHHARLLTEAGVLTRLPEGRQAWYSIVSDQRDRVAELLGTDAAAPPSDAVFDRIADDLAVRFAGQFGRETIERTLTESRELLERAGTAAHLASRTAEFTAQRLAAVAAGRSDAAGVPEVLFVCVRNAGRSQMAAALLRRLAGDRLRVRSAGSAPSNRISPVIANALDELGASIGDEFPKALTDEVVRAADVVVTMGCGDACPVYADTRYLDWDLADPVDLPLERVRVIRDDIDRRVHELLESLVSRAG